MKRKRCVLSLWFLGLILGAGCGEESESTLISPEPNHPPALEAQADTSVAVGDTLRLQAVAIDADGDSLSYYVTTFLTWEEIHHFLFPNVSMERRTGRFRFIPEAGDKPQRSFRFEAEDNRGGRDSTIFVVQICGIPPRTKAPYPSGKVARGKEVSHALLRLSFRHGSRPGQ